MTTATMETEYTVLDENDQELENMANGKRKGKALAVENPEGGEKAPEEQASEMADLMRAMAEEAAKQGFEMALKNGGDRMGKQIDTVFKDLDTRVEKLRSYMEQQSKLYAKPQNLCMHVKFKEAPPQKLSTRASPLLGDVLMQVEIGKSGGKWPLIMGPTGSGKGVLASQVAEVLKQNLYAINFSEGMGESAVFGKETVKGFIEGPAWKVAKYGGVMFLDEWDAASDNMAVSLNNLLTTAAGKPVTNPFNGETVMMHADACFIAATNTNGKGGDGAYTGRNRLDGASLNRFAMFELGYDTDLERELCPDSVLLERLWTIRVALTEKKSKDVISTRDIKDAYSQAQRGYPLDKILRCLSLRMDASNKDLFTDKAAKKSKGAKNDIPF